MPDWVKPFARGLGIGVLVGAYWAWHADLSEAFIRGALRKCESHGGPVAMDQLGATCRDGARFDTLTILGR